jgi:replicative DNA helicase
MTYSLSENIQKGTLYLLTHDLDFFSQIVTLVKPEYFDYPSYQRIFQATVGYYEKYKHLPNKDALVEFIKFTKPQSVKDDNNYAEDIEAISNIDKSVLEQREFILDLVEDFSKRGAMTEAIKKSVVLLKEEKFGDIEHLIKSALLVTRDVQIGQDYFEEVKDRVSRLFQQKAENKFRTVFDTFNRNLDGGLSAKELGIVVAPPGVGKSLYLVNQGAKSLLEGRNVLYVSLEMSEDKIANRFDSVLTHLKNAKLKEPGTQLKLHERLDLIKTKTQGRLIIKEFPTGTVNVNNIRALLVQLNLHKNFKPDLIIVDYLELLRPQRVIDSEYMAQQRIAEELRGLASETNCLLWTASQTNRQARKVAIITDAELGDSYGKIRPADWVISLNQTQEEYDKGQMRVYVLKARDSKQHYIVPVTIDYTTLKMEEGKNEECLPSSGSS